MYKKLTFAFALMILAMAAFSQPTPNPAIDKAFNDPKRAENSAKADVYIQPKHQISDDSTHAATITTTKTAATKKRSAKRKLHSK